MQSLYFYGVGNIKAFGKDFTNDFDLVSLTRYLDLILDDTYGFSYDVKHI